MLIENQEMMAELALAIEDLTGVWPQVGRLPQVSTLWHEEYLLPWNNQRKYVATIGGSNLEVWTNGEEIQVFLR